jgi:adenosine deaminase
MLDRGMKATINSDDPAYFRAYMNENLEALVEESHFTRDELVTLTRNAFEVSWATDAQKADYLSRLARVH